jgi:arsenic resistance protein ArsH
MIPRFRPFLALNRPAQRKQYTVTANMNGHGDLNNTHALRAAARDLTVDPAYSHRSFAIPVQEDDVTVRNKHRPFLLAEEFVTDDWVAQLELGTVLKLVESEILEKKQDRLRILVLYGSLRSR